MKRIVILLGILVLAGLVAGCATPQLRIPQNEIPRATKIFIKEGQTYNKVNWGEPNNFVFTEPIPNGELGKLYREYLQRELAKRGFIVLTELPKPNDALSLIVDFKIAWTPVFLGNGAVVIHLMVFDSSNPPRLILENQDGRLTSLIFSKEWILRNRSAPGSAKLIIDLFLEKTGE